MLGIRLLIRKALMLGTLFATSAMMGNLFTPEVINNTGKQAVLDVEEYLQLYGADQEKLRRMALSFFHMNELTPDIVEAYRTELVLERFHQLMRKQFPEHILPQSQWSWNNVGGVYARIKILYCNTDEYIALWGTPTPQTGFSGEYSYMDVYDIMITGKMLSYGPDTRNAVPRVYTPGDVSLLSRAETRTYTLGSHTYMIDYGHGTIPYALYQGIIAPWLFVNHDNASLSSQLSHCARSATNAKFKAIKEKFKEWGQDVKEFLAEHFGDDDDGKKTCSAENPLSGVGTKQSVEQGQPQERAEQKQSQESAVQVAVEEEVHSEPDALEPRNVDPQE